MNKFINLLMFVCLFVCAAPYMGRAVDADVPIRLNGDQELIWFADYLDLHGGPGAVAENQALYKEALSDDALFNRILVTVKRVSWMDMNVYKFNDIIEAGWNLLALSGRNEGVLALRDAFRNQTDVWGSAVLNALLYVPTSNADPIRVEILPILEAYMPDYPSLIEQISESQKSVAQTYKSLLKYLAKRDGALLAARDASLARMRVRYGNTSEGIRFVNYLKETIPLDAFEVREE